MNLFNGDKTILITGATGFIGRHFLDNIKDEYKVIAVARRSRKESNIPYHKNVQWIQCDISNWDRLKEVMNYINEHGGVDYIFHLAAFYDFTYKDNPEYERTNVKGTKNVLELAKGVNAKRLIFVSSLAACEFPGQGKVVTEETSPDANFSYAKSKRIGEEFTKEYSKYFPCTIIRLAAVFSDWCEYAPLYKFLTTWLSKKIDSRILAGKGESAVPYIHINDLISLFRIIIKEANNLSEIDIFNASPDGSVSHKELFHIATTYYFGKPSRPFYLPKFLIYPAMILRKFLQFFHLTIEDHFEKFWMIKYVDEKLNIDSSYTRMALRWEPTPRNHITRRLLFLLEKMKSHPDEWHLKNEAALKRVARRTNLIIYEHLSELKETVVAMIEERVLSPDAKETFARYQKMELNDFQCYISTLYHLLMATVRSGDRSLMIQYIDEIATRRFAEGFLPKELCETLSLYREIIISELGKRKELAKIKQEVYDYIGLTLQLAIDEVEDHYDSLIQKISIEKIAQSPFLPDCKELQRMIRQLSAFYQISPEDSINYDDLR